MYERRVTIVHRPLTFNKLSSVSPTAGSISNPFGDQLWNHYVVEVGEPGNKKRYGLDNRGDGKTVELKYEPDAKPEEYEIVKGVFIETDVVGRTSYSDEDILAIAQRLIREHGEYNIITNNCKYWATKMFNETADVNGRFGAQLGEAFGALLSVFK